MQPTSYIIINACKVAAEDGGDWADLGLWMYVFHRQGLAGGYRGW